MREKLLNIKVIVFLVFGAIVSMTFASNYVKIAKDLERNYDLAEFRFQLNKEIEENPNFLEETFDIPNDTKLTDEKVTELANISKKKSYKYIVYISLVISLLIVAVLFFPLMIFVLPIFTSSSAFKKYKLSEEDFKGSKDYFRDTLGDYNPSELSYIDDFKVDKNAIVADLLLLEQKKYLVYENGVFKKGSKKDLSELNDIEKLLMKQVLDDGSNYIKVNLLQYGEAIKKECYKDGLMEDKSFPTARFIRDILISIACFLIIMYFIGGNRVFNMLEGSNPGVQFLGMGLFVFSVIFSIYYPLYLIYKYVMLFIRLMMFRSGRTDKGEEINKKLEGLKIFIRDFSILNGREKKELILWKEYLIYSVMFNINKKVLKEYNESIKYM